MVGGRAIAEGVKSWVWFLFWTTLICGGSFAAWQNPHRRGKCQDCYREAGEDFASLPIVYNAEKCWYEPRKK